MALSEKDKKGLFIWVGFGLLAMALFGFKLVAKLSDFQLDLVFCESFLP